MCRTRLLVDCYTMLYYLSKRIWLASTHVCYVLTYSHRQDTLTPSSRTYDGTLPLQITSKFLFPFKSNKTLKYLTQRQWFAARLADLSILGLVYTSNLFDLSALGALVYQDLTILILCCSQTLNFKRTVSSGVQTTTPHPSSILTSISILTNFLMAWKNLLFWKNLISVTKIWLSENDWLSDVLMIWWSECLKKADIRTSQKLSDISEHQRIRTLDYQ